MRALGLVTALLGLAAGCVGDIDGSDPDDPTVAADGTPTTQGARMGTGGAAGTGPGATPAGDPSRDPATNPAVAAQLAGRDLAAVSVLRRLTVDEYDNTLRDLLGDNTRPAGPVIPESKNPFDNDLFTQVPDKALVEGAELLAKEAAARFIADPPRRDRVVGCKPAGVADEACFRQFIKAFGRRALHRPMPDDEVLRYMQLLKLTSVDGSFYTAVDAAIRVFLQHPEFLYRVEIGTPVAGAAGLFKLGKFELAARLAYLLQGSTPEEALLTRAEMGRLETADDVRAAAAELLATSKARTQVGRFHAQWFAYENLPHAPTLARAMQAETSGLIGRVIFEQKRPWQDLLRSPETFVSDVLIKHYGLPAPATPATNPVWIPYGTSGRRGLLSHGSFLALGNKFDDTSPTIRGKEIRERLFCEEIPPPPENVNADAAPEGDANVICKWDRYSAHRVGGCAGCHAQMDPVGFGLENFDSQGRYRAVQYWLRDAKTGAVSLATPTTPGAQKCEIQGQGEIVGIGSFKGPAELGDLMLSSGRLNRCVAAQFYRFATGRPHAMENEIDKQAVATLTRGIGDRDFRFDKLVTDYVSSAAFAHRREGQ